MTINSASDLLRVARESDAEIVSIDLFDTLVYRDVAEPKRVFHRQFDAIGHLLPALQDGESWVAVRSGTEARLSREAHPKEAHFDEIYAAISAEHGLTPTVVEALKQAELDEESRAIRDFPLIFDALRQLHQEGRRIVVTTDMYLPVAFINSIVKRYATFDFRLLCSSETGEPKRSGLAFQRLKALYPQSRIVHFGDNQHSDVKAAQREGVPGHLVTWPRLPWLKKNASWVSYLHSLGVSALKLPGDTPCPNSEIERAREELAWRWSIVQLDYLLMVRDYAKVTSVDEIWFLSRDCESMYRAVEASGARFAGVPVKYVYTSRLACYPILAVKEASVFQRWFGRAPTDDDKHQGNRSISAYEQTKAATSKSILVVDVGWKGRIQMSLQQALPQTRVFGFYFSLDADAEPTTVAASMAFIDADPGVINQAAIESLAGFTGSSCTGHVPAPDGRMAPTFRDSNDDAAPPSYCHALIGYLVHGLSQAVGNTPATAERHEHRRRAVSALCMYPDRTMRVAFEQWSVAASADGSDAATPFRGGKGRLLDKILGKQLHGNMWPGAGAWGVSRHDGVVRAIQLFIGSRKSLQHRLSRRRFGHPVA